MKAVICSSVVDSVITLNSLVMLLKMMLTIIWCWLSMFRRVGVI